MSRLSRIRLLVAAVAATLLAWPPAAASAESWSIRCANGAMTVEGTLESTITVYGWIQPCSSVAVTTPLNRFAVVYYGPDFAVPGELLRYDGETASKTSYARIVDTTQLGFPLRAVCLVFRPDAAGRIACVGDDASGLPDIPPISTGNAAVLVTVRWQDPFTHEFCGTCV